MDPQEHIHIISAGDRIHTTYPAVLKDLRTVTHTFIFAEKEVYTNSARDDAQKRMWKCAIRDAIDEVNAISLSRNISCALVCIDAATFDCDSRPGSRDLQRPSGCPVFVRYLCGLKTSLAGPVLDVALG